MDSLWNAGNAVPTIAVPGARSAPEDTASQPSSLPRYQGQTLRLGFIGLGTMGAPMVRNLLKHGYTVFVWARRPEAMAPLLASGALAAESATHVASQSAIVMTMVTDTNAVEEVILGTNGIAAGARPGSLVIDHSTI